MRSVSHYACPDDMAFAPFATVVAARGYDAVALTRRSLDEAPPSAIRAMLRERSLRVSSLNSAGYFLHADPEKALRQAADNLHLLEMAAETEACGLNVIVGGVSDQPGSLATARARALDALLDLGRHAQRYGVQLFVEPIHPAALADKGCFNTIAQVRAAVSAMPNASLTVDLFHSWWDPDLDSSLHDPTAPVGLLQICDVATDERGMATRRVVPGQGMVDIRHAVAASLRHHPGAPVELELFASGVADFDLAGIVEGVRQLIDAGAPGAAPGNADAPSVKPGQPDP